MEALKKQRATQKSAITRIETFVSTPNPNADVSDYETRELFLQKNYEDYCNIQSQIEAIDEDESKDRELVEGKYLSTWAKLKSKIKQLSITATLSQNMPQCPAPHIHQGNAKLPNINTPLFSGKVEDWQAFIVYSSH